MKNATINQKPMKEFTLMELMIAMVIAAVLLSAALPAYRTQVHNSKIYSSSNGLVSSLMTTKSESVARNNGVSSNRLWMPLGGLCTQNS